MVPGGSRPCRSSCQNVFPIDPMEDELARNPGSVKSLHSGGISPAPSYNPTPGPKLVSALIPALFPAPALPSSNKLFKQFMRIYLELNQRPNRLPVERERSLKAKVPDVYHGKLHMDCYYFCQPCKDYFKTAGAIGANWTLIAAFFLCGNINVCWM